MHSDGEGLLLQPLRTDYPARSRVTLQALLLLLLSAAAMAPATAFALDREDLTAERARLEKEFVAKMSELANWCEQNQLPRQAEQTRNWIKPHDPLLIYSPKLPVAMRSDQPPAELSPAGKEWHAKWWKLREEYAEKLYELSKNALRERLASQAYEWVLETARQNPDHEDARKALGQQQFRVEWRTPWEITQIKRGQVWHDKYGWLPRFHVDRYEKGQRFTGGRWISAAAEAQLRSNLKNGWEVETEHYKILTTHSLEEGVKLGKQLELQYRIWQHVFVPFYTLGPDATPNENEYANVSNLFEGRRSRRTFRHAVVYFRDRDEYNTTLKDVAGANITMSTGFYMSDLMKAFFFAGEEQDGTTLVHEATHQLFSETVPKIRIIGQKKNWWGGRSANFWIVEGIACYMESLKERDGYYTLGGFDNDRMRAARYHLFSEKPFYLGLEELTALDMKQFQRHPEVVKLYSQGTGLASFLMHYDHGRYREALMAYLRQIYYGRDTRHSLAELTGQSFDTLDKQYIQYCRDSLRLPAPSE